MERRILGTKTSSYFDCRNECTRIAHVQFINSYSSLIKTWPLKQKQEIKLVWPYIIYISQYGLGGLHTFIHHAHLLQVIHTNKFIIFTELLLDIHISQDSHTDIPTFTVSIVVALIGEHGEGWIVSLLELCNHHLPVSLLTCVFEWPWVQMYRIGHIFRGK